MLLGSEQSLNLLASESPLASGYVVLRFRQRLPLLDVNMLAEQFSAVD